MRLLPVSAICCLSGMVSGCAVEPPGNAGPIPNVTTATPEPPMAARKPRDLVAHGHTRVDDYYWLRERENPEVVAYLEAENEYLEAVMAPTQTLQEQLYEELVGRLQPDDASVPYQLDDYYYYWRYPEGGEYRIWARRQTSPAAAEQILFDGNAMAEDQPYFRLTGMKVSPQHDVAAFAVDTAGNRRYTRRFKNLQTGEYFPESIEDVTPFGVWANDNKTYFYTAHDPVTLRPNRIYRHVLGTDPVEDELVYSEDDEEFSCFTDKTKSRQLLVIACWQTLSSEFRFLDADNPMGDFRVVQPREQGHRYIADHLGDSLYILTDWDAPNFRLMRAPLDSSGKESWEEFVSHRDDTYLDTFELFDDFLVAIERRDGLKHIRIQPWAGQPHYLAMDETAYDIHLENNVRINTRTLRFHYTSLTTPHTVLDYDMASRQQVVLKEDAVGGHFDKGNYVTERLHAPARDGQLIPLSIVYRKGVVRNGNSPLLMIGYGSYGFTLDPRFRPEILSLLDRGFSVAIAHVRGGQIYGRRWYEDGKLFNKLNTFTDFIDCARFLVTERYTSADRLFAMGGSAGGLLMGAVANMEPDLWRGIVSNVPFVDVVTTMLDESIPLTTSEYDEWGNPNDKDAYDYILGYSPYDQIEAKAYPHMLLTAGLADSQVSYWEPAKYVARMRAMKTNDTLLLLKTNMSAGHAGSSGRFSRQAETALIYAFILQLVPGAQTALAATDS